jgi:hypothetical protein
VDRKYRPLLADVSAARIRQVADATRKAGARVALLTFVSMLLGAVAATLGGILGGELRDGSLFGLARGNASKPLSARIRKLPSGRYRLYSRKINPKTTQPMQRAKA